VFEINTSFHSPPTLRPPARQIAQRHLAIHQVHHGAFLAASWTTAMKICHGLFIAKQRIRRCREVGPLSFDRATSDSTIFVPRPAFRQIDWTCSSASVGVTLHSRSTAFLQFQRKLYAVSPKLQWLNRHPIVTRNFYLKTARLLAFPARHYGVFSHSDAHNLLPAEFCHLETIFVPK